MILVGGAKPTEGRVLVNRDGQWGSICADGWNLANANVICAQLGFGPARDPFHSTPQFPSDLSKRLYLFREVSCSTSDTNILGCSMKHMLAGDKCLSRQEVEVDCSSEKAGILNIRYSVGLYRSIYPISSLRFDTSKLLRPSKSLTKHVVSLIVTYLTSRSDCRFQGLCMGINSTATVRLTNNLAMT